MCIRDRLQPIVSAGVDAIYCPNYTQQLVAIMTAATELGYEGKIVCGLDAAPSFNTTYGGCLLYTSRCV